MTTTTLCFTCASSLLDKHYSTAFRTPCCDNPICTQCIQRNPRLARYDPCLACGGFNIVGGSATNVDGAIKDEDNYVIGDESEDEEEEEEPVVEAVVADDNDRPAVTSSEYCIKKQDTLLGISMRFGVNARELCRLNNLPPSTLSTSPNLLFTRTTLKMPPSVKLQPQDTVSESQRKKEQVSRATKRLQTLTKEVDWNVASAYVALADDPHEFGWKRKETGSHGSTNLEAIAAETYLDDEEWEEQERKAGRGVSIRPFPFASFKKD
ncbi:hypothetical protein C8J56DRAFT_790619 [Mycena floridula]|nr:hypothetical protein C8J56DRAFT_790619 [Mycena floridula]